MVNFLTGVICTIFAYAIFKSSEELNEMEPIIEEVPVNDFKNKYVTMSCQSCRKLKRHKVIGESQYECSRCKRIVDLRVS